MRGRSRAELEEKLAGKGFGPEETDASLQKLERLGYIDDSALAAALSRHARETRRLGKKGAFRFLLGRGIPAGLALDALAGYDEFEGAGALARKKLFGAPSNSTERQKKDPAAARRRLYAALARRGYSEETIRKVLSTIRGQRDKGGALK